MSTLSRKRLLVTGISARTWLCATPNTPENTTSTLPALRQGRCLVGHPQIVTARLHPTAPDELRTLELQAGLERPRSSNAMATLRAHTSLGGESASAAKTGHRSGRANRDHWPASDTSVAVPFDLLRAMSTRFTAIHTKITKPRYPSSG